MMIVLIVGARTHSNNGRGGNFQNAILHLRISLSLFFCPALRKGVEKEVVGQEKGRGG